MEKNTPNQSRGYEATCPEGLLLKKKEEHSASDCTVCDGTAVIVMQQDSTALECDRTKRQGAKSHKNHNFLDF